MGGFSFWHILILALLVLLLFGGNRFSAMMGDVAKGLKSFKEGMNEDDDRNRRPADARQLPPGQQPIDSTATRPLDPAPPPAAPPPGQSDTPQG